MPMLSRPRRNRKNTAIRDLVKENQLQVTDLIMPLFIIEGHNKKVPIESMPGQYRYTLDLLIQKVNELSLLGIKCIALFPVIEEHLKTKDAKEAYNPDGLYLNAIKEIKKACPEILLMTDIALDPYSSDGHDGLVAADGEILNDETLEVLKKMAVAQARAGSDILGPSDMMDGRIEAIRVALDGQGFEHVSIMAYTAKYASGFYGPFRDALDSAPKAGDKKTYQMDFSNGKEALRELALDEAEGADIVMIKPGLSYLDIVYQVSQNTVLPVAVYNVSGEYAMVKAAAERGWVDGRMIMVETLTAFKRAGAKIILTYFAEEMATLLKKN
ncbi:MAG: porphobilinogen synthase [Bacteriovoracaceae bacterium]|nr:porphobilinogen synthase [Halobacteriovoraceae bacterium]MDP7319996.1 porphobilinogen synthase [Bacteriovoracaceae bacterium]